MTIEIFILILLGLIFLWFAIRTAIKEAVSNAKPTTINHGTIIHHHYGQENDEKQKMPDTEKILLVAQCLDELQKADFRQLNGKRLGQNRGSRR